MDYRKSSEEIRYYNHNQAKPDIPMDLKTIKEEKPQVKKIENKEAYMDMLLEADPSKASIMKYLNDSDVYGLKLQDLENILRYLRYNLSGDIISDKYKLLFKQEFIREI